MIGRVDAVRRGMAAQSMLYDVRREDSTQLAWLYELATMAPDGIAVECGVHRGGSLICWAAAREGRGEIVAVDYKFREGFHRHLAEVGLSPRLIEAMSWEAPGLIGAPVAFCFIDADHGEPFCRDIAVWPGAIAPGGILAFHDYNTWKSPVVKREVDRWHQTTDWEFMGLVGALIAFRRPE